jgi:hypothetical protein
MPCVHSTACYSLGLAARNLLASRLALLNNLGLNPDCLTCMQASDLCSKLVNYVPRCPERQVRRCLFLITSDVEAS